MMRTSYFLLPAVALFLFLSTSAQAEPPHGPPVEGHFFTEFHAEPPHGPPQVVMMGEAGMMGPPAFLNHVFPPELVMRHQDELGVTPAQQEAMTRIMAETQA